MCIVNCVRLPLVRLLRRLLRLLLQNLAAAAPSAHFGACPLRIRLLSATQTLAQPRARLDRSKTLSFRPCAHSRSPHPGHEQFQEHVHFCNVLPGHRIRHPSFIACRDTLKALPPAEADTSRGQTVDCPALDSRVDPNSKRPIY